MTDKMDEFFGYSKPKTSDNPNTPPPPDINKINRINPIDIKKMSSDKEMFDKKPHIDLFKSDKARPEGDIETKRYRNYYDVSNTITTVQATNPNDEDHPNYNREPVFESLERNAENITVSNDGSDTLFVIVCHQGGQTFAKERPIYPGENKIYYNVYEFRLRSPSLIKYRITEYPICCSGNGSGAGSTPIQQGLIFNTALPAASTNFFTTNITPRSPPSAFKINVAISIAGKLSCQITQTSTGTSILVDFNVTIGPNLISNGDYEFMIPVASGYTYNFQYNATTGTILYLVVQEIDAVTA